MAELSSPVGRYEEVELTDRIRDRILTGSIPSGRSERKV